jgi:hypothetical protein
MTFKVERITFANTGWGVTAAFTNRSNETLRIVKKRFMLRLYKTRRVDNRTRYVYVLATGIDPPMPPTLAPGQTWRGGFGGKALPRRGEYVRVAFGRFARLAPGLPREWHWVTDHTFRY